MLAALGGAAVACGLTVVGSGSSDAGDDGPAITPALDAAIDTGEDGGRKDPQPSPDAGCVPVVVDDALTTFDELRWLASSTQADYPSAQDAGVGKPMVAVNASMQPSQRTGFWLRERVPTTAFDVTFDYLVVCTAGAYCADGVAAAWVDTNDAGALSNAGGGEALGIPRLSGGAAAIRLDVRLSNPNLSEDTFPTLMVHAMDAGPSAQTPTKKVTLDTLVGELRRVTLRLRNGQLSASSANDAGESVSIVGPTRSGFVGYFGFTAATGSHTDATYVGSFHGEFYDCEPPPP